MDTKKMTEFFEPIKEYLYWANQPDSFTKASRLAALKTNAYENSVKIELLLESETENET